MASFRVFFQSTRWISQHKPLPLLLTFSIQNFTFFYTTAPPCTLSVCELWPAKLWPAEAKLWLICLQEVGNDALHVHSYKHSCASTIAVCVTVRIIWRVGLEQGTAACQGSRFRLCRSDTKTVQIQEGGERLLLYLFVSAQDCHSERVSLSISALHWSSSLLCATNYLLPW